ncbi:MAG TPA: heme biosynthesis operon protein HemX, partial [Vibrio sp.]|nr:heme biosynthesis operon protein HemX [Vibrio sp.]
MTSKKNNDQVKSEKNEEVQEQSVETTSPTETKSEAKSETETVTDTAVEPKAQPESTTVEQDKPTTTPQVEEKQGKRGVRLGVIAIVLSILFGGGLTYHMQQKDAQYQAQLSALTAQLKQTKASITSEVEAAEKATI